VIKDLFIGVPTGQGKWGWGWRNAMVALLAVGIQDSHDIDDAGDSGATFAYASAVKVKLVKSWGATYPAVLAPAAPAAPARK
jgi:hypothetical protein